MAVYLSAPGLICCAGENRESFFSAAIRGDQSGIRETCLTGGRRFLTGLVKDEWLGPPEKSGTYGGSRLLRIMDAALDQIREDIAAVLKRWGKSRVGVCVGSCDNGSEWSLAAHKAYFAAGKFPPDYDIAFQGAAYPAEYIAGKFGLEGPALAVSTACASGAGAVIKAAELIRAGLCDAVIAGGADAVSQTVLLGFDALETLSSGICNPFSKNRSGITLGEGAAFFVLSASPDCPAGGAGIALLGAGESADAFHITSPRPDGSGAQKAMEEALAASGLERDEIGYINLHGTGTIQNDAMEALAVTAVFGGSGPPVSSTKPVTGHTLGAAGALELALCHLVLEKGGTALPPHCSDSVRDEALPALNFTQAGKPEAIPRFCMSNSFAFGGCNVSLIIGKE